ncbi:hypothetical protein G7Y89_g9503 [Cudoniella acicularis]|uniref:non-specific serine/threonine protein kinase n=1 Tax=Cudoniella acicularis TaxID=354080 RepID=A0A8H4W2I9_9HELO|nr:hypothetical protein G7Y89_g9503 [Cudoniella acicularis]
MQATPLTEAEIEGLGRTKKFFEEGNGYYRLCATRPLTIGYSLADSPVGLLAWIYEKLHEWSDDYPWTDDEVLTWVSIYYFSTAGPAASSFIYRSIENPQNPAFPLSQVYTPTPLGITHFGNDVVSFPRLWDQTLGPVVFTREHEKGGHFATWERPNAIVEDLRAMFGRNGDRAENGGKVLHQQNGSKTIALASFILFTLETCSKMEDTGSLKSLVVEHTRQCYIVLKILTAQSTASETESPILETIAQNKLPHPGEEHIITLKDHFNHKGPNGEHGCLVFEVMGPTLLGVDFLHRIGIAHSDPQPGNLLFRATDLTSVEEVRLLQKDIQPTSLVPIERHDEKADLWAPKYLAVSQLLTEFVKLDPNFVIKIPDIGGAFFTSNPPKNLVTPAGLRCPETILGEVPTSSQDIWSFGCLVFEFVTGRPLFVVDNTGDENETNDNHFLQLYSTIGPIPRDILSKWVRSDVYFNLDRENIKSYIEELPEGFDLNELHHHPLLEELFDQERPAEMSDEDSKQIKHMLRWILQYDPTKRPSASELLNDP